MVCVWLSWSISVDQADACYPVLNFSDGSIRSAAFFSGAETVAEKPDYLQSWNKAMLAEVFVPKHNFIFSFFATICDAFYTFAETSFATVDSLRSCWTLFTAQWKAESDTDTLVGLKLTLADAEALADSVVDWDSAIDSVDAVVDSDWDSVVDVVQRTVLSHYKCLPKAQMPVATSDLFLCFGVFATVAAPRAAPTLRSHESKPRLVISFHWYCVFTHSANGLFRNLTTNDLQKDQVRSRSLPCNQFLPDLINLKRESHDPFHGIHRSNV